MKGQLPESRGLGCMGTLYNLALSMCSMNICWSNEQGNRVSLPRLFIAPFHTTLLAPTILHYLKMCCISPSGLQAFACTVPSPRSTFSLPVGLSVEISQSLAPSRGILNI